MDLKDKIKNIPNFPKEGIIFRDITTLLKDKDAFQHAIDGMSRRFKNEDVDVIAGIESRGFIVGGALAYKMNKGFIPFRKPNKLPRETISHEYEKEYGSDIIEVHRDDIKEGQNVLIVDDLVATAGTAEAAIELVEKTGANIVGLVFIVSQPVEGFEDNLRKLEEYGMHTLVEYEKE
ncbi:MAG: adenine phosphoribosyltransferase [Candidatus Aenigmatarchaeota archaeon]